MISEYLERAFSFVHSRCRKTKQKTVYRHPFFSRTPPRMPAKRTPLAATQNSFSQVCPSVCLPVCVVEPISTNCVLISARIPVTEGLKDAANIAHRAGGGLHTLLAERTAVAVIPRVVCARSLPLEVGVLGIVIRLHQQLTATQHR